MGRIKSRAFRIELYPETESYDCYGVMKYIRLHYDCVWVLHDKDVFDGDSESHKKGELKKKHFHYVVRWNGSPRYASGLAKELGIEERFLLPVYGDENARTNLKYSLRYLIHEDDLEKHQYNISDVKGGGKLKELFLRYVVSDPNFTDEEYLDRLMSWISEQKYISTNRLLKYNIDKGTLKYHKKNRQDIYRLIDEHNYHFAYKDFD